MRVERVPTFKQRHRPQAEDSPGELCQHRFRCAQRIVKIVDPAQQIADGDLGADGDGEFHQP